MIRTGVPQERIVVVGNTCVGKSTFAASAAERLGLRLVELDALFWKPNWGKPDEGEFRCRIEEETRASGWVIAGNYTRHRDLIWGRADTVVWLDIPLTLVVRRVVTRSYRRWRTQELLWGTNREDLWSHLKLWDAKTSLLSLAVTRHGAQKRALSTDMADSRWSHIEFQRFGSNDEAISWLSALSSRDC